MSSDTQTKIPTTLPAKQAKLMAFIDYYNQLLVDNNIITERESLDKFSQLFSQDITEQISFCNNFFDYESTHVKSYKEKTKQSKIHQKQLQKTLQKTDKLFLKAYNQLKDPKKWNNLLLHHTQYITQHITLQNQNQDLRTLHPHTLLPLHDSDSQITHPLYQILTTKPNTTTAPYNSSKTDPIPIAETEPVNKLTTLTDVKILQLGETKYLVDNDDNVYNFTSHQYISKVVDLK